MDIIQILIIISLLSFLLIGLLVKRSSMSSYSEFTMTRGKLNWFTIACGISMTFTGGAAILTTASVGYTFKWYALIDPIALMIGLLVVLAFYKKYENDTGTTISDLLSSNHKGLSVLIGIVTSFTFILIVAANFVALSKLLSPFFPSINPLLITFVVSTMVFSYVFFGGFNSVTKTDILQFVLITALLIIPLLVFIVKRQGNLAADEITHEFSVMPIDYIILFSIPALFTPLSQDINLRIKSAKNQKNGKIGLIMGGLFYFSITLTTAYVGIYLGDNNVELVDPEQAIPFFFKNSFNGFGFIAIIASLAAIISTLDSYTLNSITSISNDIIKTLSRSEDNVSRNIKIASLITYITAMAIALFFNKVLALSLTSLLIYISVLIPVALGNKIKIPSSKILLGSVVSILFIFVIEILQIAISPKAFIYPMIGCGIVLIIKIFHKKAMSND